MRVIRTIAAVMLFAFCAAHSAGAAPAGNSIVALNGPWKFHIGDDLSWASQAIDDSQWETVDLTPKPGAHDADVGLTNYAPGWSARGHRGYTGYAWYRTTLRVTDPGARTLWLAGPADVDNAYQVYFNGHLIGGIGDFSRNPPSVFSIQPRMFALPRALWTADGGQLRGALAFRVALVPGTSATPSAESGGIHIAPLFGDKDAIADHVDAEWLQTIAGYVVEVAEPALFIMLAVMALTILPFERGNRYYPWLAAGLVLLAAQRGNQALYFFGQFETMHAFIFWRLAVIDALLFGTWTMAWHEGFKGERWMPGLIAALTAAYIIARLLSAAAFTPWLPSTFAGGFATALQGIRLAFLGVFFYYAWRGALSPMHAKWSGLAVLLLVGAGLFAQELSSLGVQGIWFPFGVGVSRTQYIYVALCPVLFFHLARRLWAHAPGRARRVPAPSA